MRVLIGVVAGIGIAFTAQRYWRRILWWLFALGD